jgi:hypothetical protein
VRANLALEEQGLTVFAFEYLNVLLSVLLVDSEVVDVELVEVEALVAVDSADFFDAFALRVSLGVSILDVVSERALRLGGIVVEGWMVNR